MAGEIAGTPPQPAPAAAVDRPVDEPEVVGEEEQESFNWRDWFGVADRRTLAILAGVIVVSLALRILTWNGIADGAHGRYVKTALFGAFASAIVWFLIRLQTTSLSRLPLICAVLVLLSGDSIHYARLLNPITRAGPILSLTPTLADEAAARRSFDFETDAGGKVTFEQGAVRLDSPPGAPAYMVGKLGNVPDVRTNWWLPVGLAERERAERFSFRARINRSGGFYVVTEIRQLLIQLVGYGIHITYPDERKQAKGYEIQHPVGADGQMHEWQLSRDAREIRLSLDGKQVWSARSIEDLNQVKLGETKKDSQHGGSMRVEAVSYSASLDRS